ncbi:MAG: hypothetical protein U5Q03_00040 [Bacteroidota bacterium]|nr:hypothetical protein [Bacteroidota bacterium]
MESFQRLRPGESTDELTTRAGMEISDFMKNMARENGSTYAKYMKGATFMIRTPNLLEKVVTMLSDIPMHDRDTKGDLYEDLALKDCLGREKRRVSDAKTYDPHDGGDDQTYS